MTAAGILPYQAFLPAHFHAVIPAEWLPKDYRMREQRPAGPRISISARGRSQTCQWFQSAPNASQPLISHKYQKEAAEFSVGLLCNVGWPCEHTEIIQAVASGWWVMRRWSGSRSAHWHMALVPGRKPMWTVMSVPIATSKPWGSTVLTT